MSSTAFPSGSIPTNIPYPAAFRPPFPIPYAILGGIPTKNVDIPLSSVFLVLYLVAGITDLIIFKKNQKRGHRFFWTQMMTSLCMSRIITMALRICWAFYPNNVRLAIASSVFVLAGVLILFSINLIFAERIFLAMHPKVKKSGFFVFKGLQLLIIVALMIIISSYVLQFYTLDPYTKKTELDAQRSGSCYLLFIAFLPIPVVALSYILPHKRANIEKFGEGRWYTKVGIVLLGAGLLALGAGFRVAVSFMPPRPVDDPAWYQSEACFWTFNFVIEIVVIYFYIIVRVDKRFHVPNRVVFVSGAEAKSTDEQVYVVEKSG